MRFMGHVNVLIWLLTTLLKFGLTRVMRVMGNLDMIRMYK
jgi:hypothetical protein